MSTGNGQLPKGWTWAKMADVATVVAGGTPSTSDDGNFGREIVWITPADLTGYTVKTIDRGERNLSRKGYDSCSARLVPAGTVLFSSRAPIGHVAIAGTELCTNQGFKNFVLQPGLLPDYVYYWLKAAKALATSMASGTTFPELSAKRAATVPIPVSPTNEQRRIVEKIDELFSDLDASVAALERVRRNLGRYRASVLKATVEGRFTEDWRAEHPDTEPAGKLLERILTERRKRWEADQLARWRKKRADAGWDAARIANAEAKEKQKIAAKYKPPAEPACAEHGQGDLPNLPDLPPGWCWATVAQCSALIQYGSSKKCSTNPTGVPVLRMGNIQTGASLDLSDLRYLPKDHYEFPALLLHAGDILFNRTNSTELVGKTAVYEGKPAPCSFASYLIRAQLLPGMEPKLLAACLNSGIGRLWIKRVMNQTVGQANVNGTKLAGFAFPLLPTAEQTKIVSIVEDKLSIIEATEQAIDKQLQRSTRLRQSILKRAFEGKLVPQDPSDEPAEKLLARIRSELQAQAAKAKTKPKLVRRHKAKQTTRGKA